MSVALYMRVSTSEQTTENQKLALVEWCNRNGITEYEIYQDQGISGKNTNRPEYIRLMNDVSAKRVKVVVVWAIDRFSRSVLDFTKALQDFLNLNVRFVSVSQGLDIEAGNVIGQFVANLLIAVAQLERATLLERTKAGLERAKKQGKKLGRKPVQGLTPALLRNYLKRRLTKEEIAKELNISVATLYRRLRKHGLLDEDF